jgi:uncharacterized protein YecE (DUF72 family)
MIWIGTSGFQYEEWKGTFYPADLSKPKMLSYYAQHFPTTEINYSFRHIPTEKTLLNWKSATPEIFRFTFKAPQTITHHRKLKGATDTLRIFCGVLRTMENKLGTILFQLPPDFEKDAAVLKSFLEELPPDLKCAFEFRHASWFDEEIFSALRAQNAALCIADSEKLKTPVEFTADFGYFRLRDEGYTPKDIANWAKVIAPQEKRLKDIYVYFKHEESGIGPKFAKQLNDCLTLEKQGTT